VFVSNAPSDDGGAASENQAQRCLGRMRLSRGVRGADLPFDDRQSRVTVQHMPTLSERLTRPPFTKSTSCQSGPLSWGA
jgi:hypothetical protein